MNTLSESAEHVVYCFSKLHTRYVISKLGTQFGNWQNAQHNFEIAYISKKCGTYTFWSFKPDANQQPIAQTQTYKLMNTQNGYSKLSACALRQNIMLIYWQHSICTLCLIIDVILAKMQTMSDKIGKSTWHKNYSTWRIPQQGNWQETKLLCSCSDSSSPVL